MPFLPPFLPFFPVGVALRFACVQGTISIYARCVAMSASACACACACACLRAFSSAAFDVVAVAQLELRAWCGLGCVRGAGAPGRGVMCVRAGVRVRMSMYVCACTRQPNR